MSKLPPLNAIRAFEAASRHLSFQEAAREIGVTPSALSHQIRLLEEQVGQKLFVRKPRAVQLTAAGAKISGKVSEGFESLKNAFALLHEEADTNTLVISTGPAFSSKWLAPRIHYFLEENPEIDFRLSASLSLVDFEADGVDAGIRFGGGNYPDLFVEKLFNDVAMPLVSAQLWQSLNIDADEAAFERLPLIHDDSSSFLANAKNWEHWLAAKGYDPARAQRGSHFSHADHSIEAALDGAGILLARLGLAWRDVKAGRLIAPFNLALVTKGGFYFVCPESHLERDRVLRFLGWVRDEAAEQAEGMTAFLADFQVQDLEIG